MNLKIYSWNMLYSNPDLDRAYSFIENLDFDVLCLQEVPYYFLEHLRALPVHIVSCVDSGRIADTGTSFAIYCVILSRYAIIDSREIEFPDPPHPLRTRVFKHIMQPRGWHRLTNRHGLCADIEIPATGRTRVFCLHISLTHPALRRAEFDTAMHSLDPQISTIVCGDFNILESPRVTLLNWLLGGRLRDIFAWKSERTHIEARFRELSLRNPLRGKRTQTISHSQLDHILISPQIQLVRAGVVSDRCGSDHHPIFIECGA